MSTKNVLRITNEEGRTYEFQKPTKADYKEAVKFWELYNDFLDRKPTYSQKEAIRVKMQKNKRRVFRKSPSIYKCKIY